MYFEIILPVLKMLKWSTWWTRVRKVSWCSPGSPAAKESTCNAGDSSLIRGLGRFPREAIGYPLQYSLASLVVQMVKSPPVMWETRVQSVGWEDPLEEGIATHSSILGWRIPMDRGAWRATVHGVTERETQLSDWAHSTHVKLWRRSQLLMD